MDNSVHGMGPWHGANNNQGQGQGQWYPGPYGYGGGPYNGPPGPPPPGWNGWNGAGGYGPYTGFAGPWGYGVPPGMPPPLGPPPQPPPPADNTNNNNSSNNNNKNSNNSSNSNPPLPPGPPPGETSTESKDSKDKAGSSSSTQATPEKPPETPNTQQSPATTNPSSPMTGYNPQNFSNPSVYNYNHGYAPSYENYGAYGAAWYNPTGPPPRCPPPNFPQPPMGRGSPNQGGPIKFNLPSKKGLGYNALQQGQQLQQDMQQQQAQQQQQQVQQEQEQQHGYPQQNAPNSKKNKKNRNKNNANFMAWNKVQFMNKSMQQQQHQQQQQLQQQQQQHQQHHQQQHHQQMQQGPAGKENSEDVGSLAKPQGPGDLAASSSTNPTPKQIKDIQGVPGLVAKGDWPESLKAYVGRCFARCQTELDKDQVEICLKGKLTQAANNGTLWTKNWEEEPLPSIHSQATINALSQMKNWSSPTPTTEGESDTSSSSPMKQHNKKAAPFKKQLMSSGYSARGGRSHHRPRSRSPSRSRSRSHSRSRSRSPTYKRNRRDSKRRHSSDSDEDIRKGGFIGLRRGKSPGGMRGGKGMKKMKGKNKMAESHFYSKHGRMSLDPEFSTNERLEKRAARFSMMGGQETGLMGGPPKKKKQPLNITKTINNTRALGSFTVDGDDIDWTSIHIVGTCTVLEKQYLRLTAAPDPSTVRTVETLRRALEHIKRQWVRNLDYHYACDQLKSLRQDLTIQGVRDQFTVQVYETHSRIALEKGDHEEFNQCQSQLKQLYQEVGGDNALEFIAYRLLYYIFTKNTLDITSLMAGLTAKHKEDECISFALRLRAAWSLGNYHRFFQLYRMAPKMAGYLIDWFADRERRLALRNMIKGYRPGSLDVSFIRAELALGTQEEWDKFESSVSLIYTDASHDKVDCKKSTAEAPVTQ